MSEFEQFASEFQGTVANFRSEVEKSHTRIDALEATLKRASVLGDNSTAADTGGAGSSIGFGPFQPLTKNQKLRSLCKATEDLSLVKTLRGLHFGTWDGAEAEREATIHKGQSISPDTSGGFLVAEQISSTVIDLARAQSVCMAAGAQTIPVSGFTTFPRVTGDPTLSWRGENAEIPASEATLGTYRVAPKTLGVLIPISIELLEDASPAIEAVLRSILASAFAAEIDRVLLAGNGVSEPGGILDRTDVHQALAVGALTYDDLLDAAAAIYGSNFAGSYSDLSAILNPRTMGALSKAKEATTNAYLRRPDEATQMKRFQTSGLAIASGPSTTDAIVGHFPSLALALRTGLQIEFGRQGSGFSKLQVAVRAYLRADAVAFQPKHFVALRGITN